MKIHTPVFCAVCDLTSGSCNHHCGLVTQVWSPERLHFQKVSITRGLLVDRHQLKVKADVPLYFPHHQQIPLKHQNRQWVSRKLSHFLNLFVPIEDEKKNGSQAYHFLFKNNTKKWYDYAVVGIFFFISELIHAWTLFSDTSTLTRCIYKRLRWNTELRLNESNPKHATHPDVFQLVFKQASIRLLQPCPLIIPTHISSLPLDDDLEEHHLLREAAEAVVEADFIVSLLRGLHPGMRGGKTDQR